MNKTRLSALLFSAALLFSFSAFAKESNKATLVVADKITVEGKTIEPGTYKVEWTGDGSTVQVSIIQDRQTVATFSAHVTEQGTPNIASAYTTDEANGVKSLTAIYIGGKKSVLEVGQSQASQQATANPAK
jgi:hypothetical protein